MTDDILTSPNNAYEFTVSELANSLKRTVEDTYGHVRVRGELGRVTIAKSGHCYLDVKDDRAVINSIIWKGVMSRLSMRPEEGMEVIIEGKLSTYPGRSNYQLIIDKMELAGAGALMALYEKRKKAFAAEGLFSPDRKVALPFLPQTIGVVTSPTGSVIRDILHRIADRYPSHVLVWPVLVQGDRAAEQIASAIRGFNTPGGFPRPDVLIVARGGGSMEDLWCFNEDVVVRAASESTIPLISAVGHETDWTLIDYVADYRAPTPTGAAEVCVPVLSDYSLTVQDYGVRLTRGLRRNLAEKRAGLGGAKLPRLESVLSGPQQKLDLAIARLPRADRLFEPARQKLALMRLPDISRLTETARNRVEMMSSRLKPALQASLTRRAHAYDMTSKRLRRETVERSLQARTERLTTLARTAERAVKQSQSGLSQRLERASKLLEAYSYQNVLSRGYALVQTRDGALIRESAGVDAGQAVTLTFADGSRGAIISGADGTAESASANTPTPSRRKKSKETPDGLEKKQADLF